MLAAVTVSNNNDVVNGDVTSIAALIASDGGDGISLREAIQAANADAGVADDVTFEAALDGLQILLTVAQGELAITDPLSIDASALAGGITINGNDPSGTAGDGIRIFNIDDSAGGAIAVTLNNLTLTGGDVSGGGGAIFSSENLTVTNCTITGNEATSDGGGVAASYGTTTITNSTISGNFAGEDGGGLAISGGTASITNSTISGNMANLRGGGIYVNYGADTEITNSTISGNSAGNAGGGIYAYFGSTAITNSTISGNTADDKGGGIYAYVGSGDSLTIQNSTITLNTSDFPSGGAGSGGGMYLSGDGGSVDLENTIIAGNTDNTDAAPDIDNTTATDNPTLTVSFTLVGNNEGSGLAAGALVGTNAMPINPLLGPLGDNGGPTLTHAVLLSSPALDAGNPLFLPPPNFDQRGAPFDRVVNGDGVGGARLDIGAFEFLPPPPPIVLGSEPTIILPDETIFDEEIVAYQYRAHDTGKLVVYAYFDHENGDIDLQVLDQANNVLASSSTSSPTQDFEELIIPVVFNQRYFIQALGVDIPIFNGGQHYALEVENFPTPVPTGVDLDPASDTGMMNNDNVTSDTTPTFFIQTDVLNFVDTNGNGTVPGSGYVPSPRRGRARRALARRGECAVAGCARSGCRRHGRRHRVEVTLVNTTDGTVVTGFAEAVIGVSAGSVSLHGAGSDAAHAGRVSGDRADQGVRRPGERCGRSGPEVGPQQRLAAAVDHDRRQRSPALDMVSADLLNASDTGMFNDDNVTNKMQPAFQGIAPVGSKVRLYVFPTANAGVGRADRGRFRLVRRRHRRRRHRRRERRRPGTVGNHRRAARRQRLRHHARNRGRRRQRFPIQSATVDDDEAIDIVVDTVEPEHAVPGPAGRHGPHNNDNITKDNTPRVSMTTTDPNIALAKLLFTDNLKFRIFDRFKSSAAGSADLRLGPGRGCRQHHDARRHVHRADAAHADAAGADAASARRSRRRRCPTASTISSSKSKTAPATSATTSSCRSPSTRRRRRSRSACPTRPTRIDGLAAASDTGVTTVPATFADRVTSDTTPTLLGPGRSRHDRPRLSRSQRQRRHRSLDRYVPGPDDGRAARRQRRLSGRLLGNHLVHST